MNEMALDRSAQEGAPGMVELTILMPCLNEAETLAICIEKAQRFLDTSGVVGEVLIADNGSTDGSQAIAEGLGARVVPVEAKGYGAALLGGIAAARGTYIIMGDSDDSYDFSALQPFVDSLREGNDLVMGNRFKGGIRQGAMPFKNRYLGNPVLSFVGQLFFRIPVRDFHCGLRGFRAEVIRELDLRTTGMEFASEMVVKSALKGLRISEVPTTLDPDGRSRPPHLKPWRDGWRHLKFLLLHSPRWAFMTPGSILLGLGLLSALILLATPVTIGTAVLDLNSFMACCFAALIGLQMLSVGLVTRTYAGLSGFLPWSDRVSYLDRILTTDRMALAGAAVTVIGLIIFIWTFAVWAGAGFGELERAVLPKLVVSGLTLMAMGVQILVAAFLMGMLRIPFLR